MIVDAELYGDVTYQLAEGPVWDDATDTVSWIDIVAGKVFQGQLGDAGIVLTKVHSFPSTVGAAVPTVDGGLLVATRHDLLVVPRSGERSIAASLLDPTTPLRLNDGSCDPAGRFVVGSLPTDGRQAAAELFRVEHSGETTVLRRGLNLSNGLGWSPAGDVVYHVDSKPGVVSSATYDAASGVVGPWKALIDGFPGGLPDGLCVDTAGRLWIAVWGSGQVRCYAPTGEQVGAVRVPAPHVTSVCLVGPARDRLLVTTARDELSEHDRSLYPLSGRLFIAAVDAEGLPTRRWAGRAGTVRDTTAPTPPTELS